MATWFINQLHIRDEMSECIRDTVFSEEVKNTYNFPRSDQSQWRPDHTWSSADHSKAAIVIDVVPRHDPSRLCSMHPLTSPHLSPSLLKLFSWVIAHILSFLETLLAIYRFILLFFLVRLPACLPACVCVCKKVLRPTFGSKKVRQTHT